MESFKPGFFIEGKSEPESHLQNTLHLMLTADAWIAIMVKDNPINGLEVDVKSANLTAEQLNKILQYAVDATSGPPIPMS